ncbi:MAG: hypothetical protein O2973_09005 [Gemmatimonadetes bacterium]|nr:hypothetical protein [Gemmatimonadota bacterium]
MPVLTQGTTAPIAPTLPTAPIVLDGATPGSIYRALVSQRDILDNQLRDVTRLRSNLVDDLNSSNLSPAGRASVEARIANADARIADLDQQIAQTDANVAQAAAVPGATVRPPSPPRDGPPEEVFVLSALFMFIVILPMSLAFARRIWRRSARVEVRMPAEMGERMESLERGVEAVALEVERIGEGQRFVTQALTQRGEIRGAGAAEPVPVPLRDRVEERL